MIKYSLPSEIFDNLTQPKQPKQKEENNFFPLTNDKICVYLLRFTLKYYCIRKLIIFILDYTLQYPVT